MLRHIRFRKVGYLRFLRGLIAFLVIACAADSQGEVPGQHVSAIGPGKVASAESTKRVLLLFGDDQRFPMVNALSESIRSTLDIESAARIEYHTEYVDRSLIGDAVYERDLVKLWQTKYEGRRMDLIFVSFRAALDLISRHRAELFDAPTVFCTVMRPELSTLAPKTTGVWSASPFGPNLELALIMNPDTQRIVVLFGSDDSDMLEMARSELRDYESRVEIVYLSDLSIGEYQERLAGLPERTVVLFGNLTRDREGHRFTTLESLSRIAPVSAAPIYGCTDVQVGSGTVGGHLVNFELLGARAGEMAARVLAGEKPESLPPQSVPTVLMFDWRELNRWGISESSLPAGSVVLFRARSIWSVYKWYALALIFLVVAESLLITGLVINRTRRKRAEADRRQAQVQVEASQARLAGIIGSAMDAIISIDERERIVLFNDAAQKMFGCAASDVLGQTLDRFIPERFRQPHHRHLRDFAASGVTTRTMGALGGIRGRRSNGEEFPIEASISQIELRGHKFYTAILRDITERHRALEALRESEERFRNMADTAPVMIWVSGSDKLCIYFNQQWLKFTGRSLDDELGNGWTEGVHPDDFQRCLDTYNDAFDRREPFTMEYRLRRADGEFRWILDSGRARFSPGGKFLGYIGSCIDITERKATEDALANLSGQLIQAREDECARIARELHDDVNQRMALVSIQLAQLGQDPAAPGALRAQLKEVMSHIAETAREIHRMSYDLHPSKLAQLGLVAALETLCKELRQRHEMRIEFIHHDLPPDLTRDISLCLYRIAQECLNNVIRHSGVKEAEVELWGTGTEVRLRVSDSGAGFDVESPTLKRGLGLMGMRERLRLVGGIISIESRPSLGTEVEAIVPLPRESVDPEARASEEKARGARG